ncbi:LPS assembly lipoprotein LptE [Herminiimonas sp. CN]|uniref:LPS-assembly lipoprotein LptE n=1 Tax=Herminiimonas sp. CN TaxID=1349818 RepID=UPI00047372CA|nr:LPS assembly lipoprotein LptE [Herminiimonas sp. CN]
MTSGRPALLKYILGLLLAALLSACGFHLRGAADMALPFKTIYLGFADTSTLGNSLKRNIRGAGSTVIVTDARDAEGILDVLSETREKSVLSLNNQGRVREYTLAYAFRFRVRDGKNNELLAPTEIRLTRDMNYDDTQTLAKEGEEAMLYRDMQNDLVQQILRRMSAIRPQ